MGEFQLVSRGQSHDDVKSPLDELNVNLIKANRVDRLSDSEAKTYGYWLALILGRLVCAPVAADASSPFAAAAPGAPAPFGVACVGWFLGVKVDLLSVISEIIE